MPAGYSGTPLPKKLGLSEGHSLLLINAPSNFEKTLGTLPLHVQVSRSLRAKGPFQVILFFAASVADLQARMEALLPRLDPSGGLWIAWPKKSSGIKTDLGDGVVRATGLETGLVDNKVCAIDETWSGLRFVVRLKDRPRTTKQRQQPVRRKP